MVVGMRFRGGHKFKKSDTITLEPEPSNTYDKNAIKIMVDGIHKAYVAKDENVSIGDLMRRYPRYRVNAHGKKNYNQSASLNLEYPWMICERCRDTLQASRDYDYKEKLDIMEKKEREKLDIMEKKEGEKLDIMDELRKVENTLRDRTQELLRSRRICDIRGAMEFIRAQLLMKTNTILFSEPADKALNKLTEDQLFVSLLKRMCKLNSLRYEDVRKCIGGLYHHSSKLMHGHKNDVVIDARDWAPNEVAALGTMFNHFKISYSYCNDSGNIDNYPFTFNNLNKLVNP
ncbi:5745_t:CDS:2 [Entrophospora sp. SA101]|nr:5745_t:CDS:2 [Entrophospora sp. SA101]